MTEGFRFYGHVALLADPDSGAWETLFFAVPAGTDTWALQWDAAGVDGAVAVALKNSAPPVLGRPRAV